MRRTTVVLAVLCLLLAAPARAEEDALPIVQKAFEHARANEALARSYVYHERVAERRFTKKSKEKKRGSRTYDVTQLDGSEFRRLIAIDDKPLFPKTVAKEQRRLEKQLEKMRKETPKQRKKRLAKVQKGREEGERFLEEITRAFDFRVVGEETVDGISTWVISAEPKEGYDPPSREAKVLTRLRARVWISKEEHAWVRAEMETFDVIKWGVIFKLHEGATIRFKQRKINDEVWLTESWHVRMRSRAALVFKFNGELTGSYSNYRKFTTDSKVVQGDAKP